MKCNQIRINTGTHISFKCITFFSSLTTDRHIRIMTFVLDLRDQLKKKKILFHGGSCSASFFLDE